MSANSDHIFDLPPQEISTKVLAEKYLKGSETTADELRQRVARGIAAPESAGNSEAVEAEFLWAQRNGFVPAGRINSAAGTSVDATLANCFVQPIGDSIGGSEGGFPGIYTALAQAAETMRRGGGVGYDFSRIRPKGARVKSTHSQASGPISYMHIFDRSCETVESAGARRGAQMGVLRCEHPDIQDFIRAKANGSLSNFNISIGVTDSFMRAVVNNETFDLFHAAEPSDALKAEGAYQREDGKWVYRTVQAVDLWDAVMKSTYNHAEPGILFLDRINQENNLAYCETIEATNPCAEQGLPPHGCCCLGSINLVNCITNPFTPEAALDKAKLTKLTRIGIRFLDNVLDATMWPLEEQKLEAANKRRVGLGFLGLGNALTLMGIRYDSQKGREFAQMVAETMRDAAYEASCDLAVERGAFPLFDAEKYLAGPFAQRLPQALKDRIAKHGLRNSHLLSIAPTGTISLALGQNATGGIEPAFAWTYERKVRRGKTAGDGFDKHVIDDYAYRLYCAMNGGKRIPLDELPEAFVSAQEISAVDHMRMLEAVQPHIDAAISKTVNIPADYPYEDFKDIYVAAWKAKLKGIATYRPNSVLGSVLSVETKPAEAAPAAPVATADVDPLSVAIRRSPEGDLPAVRRKIKYWVGAEEHTIYLMVSFAKVDGVVDGQKVTIERPIEFFIPSQYGEGQQWVASHMVQMSTSMRFGAPVDDALKNMMAMPWDKALVQYGHYVKADGSKVPRSHKSDVAMIGYALQQVLIERGFLDAEGNQVPARKLVQRLAAATSTAPAVAEAAELDQAQRAAEGAKFPPGTGKTCPECGAKELHKVDGCTRCQSCDHEGGCG